MPESVASGHGNCESCAHLARNQTSEINIRPSGLQGRSVEGSVLIWALLLVHLVAVVTHYEIRRRSKPEAVNGFVRPAKNVIISNFPLDIGAISTDLENLGKFPL